MSTWYKEGVYGDLSPEMEEGKRKVSRLYARKGKDFFITSKRDGTHGAASFHPGGNGLDFRQNGVLLRDIRKEAGPNFDVTKEPNHIHMEYDPK